jgi:transcription elongation GreA/GreB family factor
MDKRALVEQLSAQIMRSANAAQRAGEEALLEARDGATAAEKREDARVALEGQSLARAQSRRVDKARAELATLETFRPDRFVAGARIAVGAIVEVEDGDEGRTFFLAPVGAGIELTGPGGDGYLSVVTPASPVGRAVLGRKVGDTIEIQVRDDVKEWTITYVA